MGAATEFGVACPAGWRRPTTLSPE
ncbi:hypothetical protein ACFVT1_16585 [Streptomyces sp. NPDC057963]